jgi:non-heme chloroperoxidase
MNTEINHPTLYTPRTRHTVKSIVDVLPLAVQEWGNLAGTPVLLVHAWSQSHLSWGPQLTSTALESLRLISFDQRGHGESGKPAGTDAYAADGRWGDDVHSVVQALGLDKFVLVGWSMGSLVALDYIKQHGGDRVLALNLVAGVNAAGNARGQSHFGAAAAHVAPALGTELSQHLNAMLALQQALVYCELSVPEFGMLFAQSLVAAPSARLGLLSRSVDHELTLREWRKPLLLSHGDTDAVITIQAARDAAAFAPHAKLSIYPGAGHAPHWEDPPRFDRELVDLIRSVV